MTQKSGFISNPCSSKFHFILWRIIFSVYIPGCFLHNKRNQPYGGTYLGVLEVSAPVLNRLGSFRIFFSPMFQVLVDCDIQSFGLNLQDYGVEFNDDVFPTTPFHCRCGSEFCKNSKKTSSE